MEPTRVDCNTREVVAIKYNFLTQNIIKWYIFVEDDLHSSYTHVLKEEEPEDISGPHFGFLPPRPFVDIMYSTKAILLLRPKLRMQTLKETCMLKVQTYFPFRSLLYYAERGIIEIPMDLAEATTFFGLETQHYPTIPETFINVPGSLAQEYAHKLPQMDNAINMPSNELLHDAASPILFHL